MTDMCMDEPIVAVWRFICVGFYIDVLMYLWKK